MSDTLNFFTPTQIMFGTGSLENLSKVVKGANIFIVMDQFLYDSNVKEKIDALMSGFQLEYFTRFKANPDVEAINRALLEIRAFQATSVVGIGGGSTLDIAKFLAIAMKETCDVEEMRANGFSRNEKITSVCIPTTAGTGSEVTNVSVISNYKTKQKSPFVDDRLFADIALLDPKLTLSLPKEVTASCGMDTFCHAIEAYWNRNANAISDLLAEESLRLVLLNLINCYDVGNNLHARSEMLKASLYAGLAFAQTRTTVLHAVSFPLTSEFHIPHGIACSILLPTCIRQIGKDSLKIQLLAKKLGYSSVEKFAEQVEELMGNMMISTKLSSYGIEETDLEMIAEASLKEKISFLTPIDMTKDTMMNLLKEVQ